MAENRNWSVLCSCALILLALDMLPSTAVDGAPTTLHAYTNLVVGYYRYSCPDAEQIISDGMAAAFKWARHTAPGVLRLHFHDCFVHGCDGSVLIDSANGVTAEKDGFPNANSLHGFEAIDRIKSELEYACPGVVSCADILAYAARDSVVLTGGPTWDVEAGRRDGVHSSGENLFDDLPRASANVAELTANFAAKGLSQDDMVTLSGGHTIGQSHCGPFSTRIDPSNPDPTMTASLASQLAQVCPAPAPADVLVDMDPTATVFDTRYYWELMRNRGLFTSDQVLADDAATRGAVEENARHRYRFFRKFARAMVRMGRVGVLTGTQDPAQLQAGQLRLMRSLG